MPPLLPWMRYLLRFSACYNLLAGLTMFAFYHEAFRLLQVPKPELLLPIQLVGILVALFGLGYWLVADNPLENRNILLLGFLSKLGGSLLGIWYVLRGRLPWEFSIVLFFSDIIYLPPFVMILRRLYELAGQRAR